MRVLLIGGSGFVTGGIARLAREAGHELICGSRTGSDDGRTHVHCDARQLSRSRERLRAVRPDAVIHGVCYSRSDAEELLACFDDVPLVVLSSMDRYDGFARAVAGEATGPHPTREDAALASDFAHQEERKGHPYDHNAMTDALDGRAAVLHLPMVYGPEDPQVAFRHGPLLHASLSGEPAILGMGEAARIWTFGYVDDVAAACLHAVGHVGSWNVAEAELRTLREWAGLYGAEVAAVPDPWLDMDGPQPHLIADASAFARDTSFEEPVGSVEGARRTLAWHRVHGIDAPGDLAERRAALERWRRL